MITSTGQAGFRVSVASGDALDTREFKVQERMSALFSVTVSVVAHDADLDFEAIVGQPASFEVEASAERRRTWTGICKELHQVATEDSGLSSYQIEIVPTLWLATQRRNHRIFQGLSDVDIATALMAEWGVVPVKKLSGAYKKRKYRVQYGESDYAFICRLLEDAGVSFYFMDAAGSTMLVLSDAPHADAPRETLIPFRDHPSDADREHVTAVRIGRRLRPGRYAMRDHDYRRPPSFKLMGTAALASGVEEKLEEFHFAPGAFLFEGNGDATPHADDRGQYRADPAEGDAMARRRLEAKRSEALTCAFETNALDLAPGVVFGMRWHPQRDLGDDRRLLVTASTMTGTTGQRWKHACEARSAATPFRPALSTPKPSVRGVESATVVGPAGEEIHTDEFGRVRAHFHWDRESRMNDESSCWIHVSQSWGGAMFGGVNLPRVGQEVLVDFLGGDPDRPVIVGRVYTNLQRVPYKLPENKTQSGWKSCSTGGAGGYNEIMFEDAAGEELLRVQAERDLQKLVKRDERGTIRRNRSTYVGEIDATTVGNTHVVMISPPAEGGLHTSSSITMTDKKIVLDTGAGATIVMDHDRITIEADDLVEIWGKKRGVNLHAPAPGGKTNLFTGDSFNVATQSIVLAGNDVSIAAIGTLKLDGTGSATLTSSGTTNVAGTPVQLNGPGLFAGRVTEQAPATITTGAALVLVGGASFPFAVVKQADGSLKVGDHLIVKQGQGRYPDFQNRVMRDLGIMSSTPAGLQRLNNIESNPGGHNVTIREYSKAEADNPRLGPNNSVNYALDGANASPTYDQNGNLVPGSGSSSEIGYNPDIGLGPSGGPNEPGDAVLFHELGHADHAAHGIDRGGETTTGSLAGYENREEWQTIDGGVNKPGGTQVAGQPPSPSENEYLGQRGYPYRRTDHGNGYKPG